MLNFDNAQNIMIAGLGDKLNDAPGASVRLYVNDITPTPLTVVADLTEASFSGYAAIGPVADWNGGYDPETGQPIMYTHVEMNFVADGGGPLENVYGFYILDKDGTLVCARRLASPVTMQRAGDRLLLDSSIRFASPLGI
jgi:hypothetical protein